MAFFVRCDAHDCGEVAPLVVKGMVFNPVNELPNGWRVITWAAAAPLSESDEENPAMVAMQGLVEGVGGVNPIAARGFKKMVGAMEIGQQLAAMKRMEIRRACVCPKCAAKLPLGSGDVVGEVMPEPMFPGMPGMGAFGG
jgi:hypothetical protein